MNALKRLGKPVEVAFDKVHKLFTIYSAANAALFLDSDKASYLSGDTISVAGGTLNKLKIRQSN